MHEPAPARVPAVVHACGAAAAAAVLQWRDVGRPDTPDAADGAWLHKPFNSRIRCVIMRTAWLRLLLLRSRIRGGGFLPLSCCCFHNTAARKGVAAVALRLCRLLTSTEQDCLVFIAGGSSSHLSSENRALEWADNDTHVVVSESPCARRMFANTWDPSFICAPGP